MDPDRPPDHRDPWTDDTATVAQLKDMILRNQLTQQVAHELQDLARAIETGKVIGIEQVHWSPGSTAWTIHAISGPAASMVEVIKHDDQPSDQVRVEAATTVTIKNVGG